MNRYLCIAYNSDEQRTVYAMHEGNNPDEAMEDCAMLHEEQDDGFVVIDAMDATNLQEWLHALKTGDDSMPEPQPTTTNEPSADSTGA